MMSIQNRSLYNLAAISTFFILLLIYASDTKIKGQDTPESTTSLAVIYCKELIVQGDFESGLLGWGQRTTISQLESNPIYVTEPTFSGSMAIRLGLDESTNVKNTNMVYQELSLPAEAAAIVLSFHYFAKHGETPGADLQYVDVVDTSTDQRIIRPWSQLTSRESWGFHQIDLTFLKSKSVRLEFGVVNDGRGESTRMYLDKVSVMACGSGAEFLPESTHTFTDFNSDTPAQQPADSPSREMLPSSSTAQSDVVTNSLPTPTPSVAYVLPLPTLTDKLTPTVVPVSVPRIVIADAFLSGENKDDQQLVIVLLNLSDALDLDGWSLSDGYKNVYRFQEFGFAAMSVLKFHIDYGQHYELDAINDAGEQVILKDSMGTIIDIFTIRGAIPEDW